jgi:MFS family permease
MPARLSPDSILRDGAFRRLVVAEGFAYTGEALLIVLFTLIALDAGPTGATIVLVAQGIPRALLLPLGGLLSDRWGAARVALASAIARAVLLVALAGLVLAAGVPSIAVLAGLGALLGVVDALAYPASFALVPAIVPAERLPAANSVIGGIEGLGDLAGPAAAAGLYALLGAGASLAVVAALAAVSALGFLAVARHGVGEPTLGEATPAAFLDGIRHAWADEQVRRLLLGLVALSLLLAGPLLVGGAVLAEERFGSREAIGVVLAGWGAGALAGLALAPRMARLRPELATALGGVALGAGFVAIAFAPTIAVATGAAVLMGVVGSALGVVLLSWLQERTPEDLRGRIMALVAFAFLALDPLSYAVAGLLLPLGATATLAIPGALLLALSLLTWPRRS